jgi:hypothetical protein
MTSSNNKGLALISITANSILAFSCVLKTKISDAQVWVQLNKISSTKWPIYHPKQKII